MSESVFNTVRVNGLFRIDVLGGEDHAEFSTAVDSGDRTVIQAVSTRVEGPQAAGGIRLVDPGVEQGRPSDDTE